MILKNNTVFDILSRLRISFQRDNLSLISSGGEPFRSELYSTDQMDRHGEFVARSHKLMELNGRDQLLRRLDDNEKVLLEVRNLLMESIMDKNPITPGGEWLLDNFYLVEEQIVIARKHLPRGYSEALPYLSEGPSAGMPRVYDIVLEMISHSDGRVDVKSLSSFIQAYQQCSILTLGELWAIPIMVRLAVIENLRRVCGKIALDMVDHNLGDYWADRMIDTVSESPGDLIMIVADMARTQPLLVSPFVAAFTRKLQGKGPALALPLSWMEQQLGSKGSSGIDLVRQENQKQAADQVSVRNSIGTLRFISATDWREFVESMSSVEQVLRRDPGGIYPLMDFATRDRYRHVVESVAKASQFSETEIAQKVIDLSNSANKEGPRSDRERHVGYYLISKGLRKTHRITEMRHSWKEGLFRYAGRIPVFLYLFSIVALTVVVSVAMVSLAFDNGLRDTLLSGLLTLVTVAGAAQLAISLVNWLSALLVKPELLPRMDYSGGIPAANRTLVVVPTMLIDRSYIEEMVEAMEIRFLANREDHLHFVLATDFMDAEQQFMPEDQALVDFATERIQALNQKYKPVEKDLFFLFHRDRTWNSHEGKWMGYERKRGKISALNSFLRGKPCDFSTLVGSHEILKQVKYVITLDSDTQLPREAVWKFVATMAHPLNRPVFDSKKRRVTEGYGVLQPRLASAIPKKTTSPYMRMQGDVFGIDPYTRVSSDVYQDIFRQGSYIGKGIYDVDLFEKALDGVFQENRILSHDLLEGCYTRSGLLSDVLLYEENPSQYQSDIKRRHRWIRGDWQIGAWMLPYVTGSNGRLRPNKLSLLSRWKIFDNLRRSLLPLSLLTILLMGWMILPFPWFWTAAVTLIILLPVMAAAGWQLINKPDELSFKAHLSEIVILVKGILVRFVFGIAVLPYEALVNADAVVRTNWRMIVSGKKLLEWTPSEANSRNSSNDALDLYRSMWIAPTLALVTAAILAYVHPEALIVAAPLLILWVLAPAMARKVSMADEEESLGFQSDQLDFLHKTARKTWAFFEDFITEKDNWLPPDNYQKIPGAKIAHRTSPTNLGLALLANLTAYDFGYISGSDFLLRCHHTLLTMSRMDRYKGHFYNWYDTITCQPMLPRYISTVDSGNLIGHLLTLRQGIIALPAESAFGIKNLEGLRTTAKLIEENSSEALTGIAREMLTVLDDAVGQVTSITAIRDVLDRLQLIVGPSGFLQKNRDESANWLTRFEVQLAESKAALNACSPWIDLLPVPGHFTKLGGIDHILSIDSIERLSGNLKNTIREYENSEVSYEDKIWLASLLSALENANVWAREKINLVKLLEEKCEEFSTVAFDFLFDKSTSLLRIGYNVDEGRKDDGNYDLLASEVRLGIFVGIAQGKLPQESWFALGRLLTNAGGDPILLSWSGSMFEYLMPELVMPSYTNTLLYQTNKATVKRQIEYGGQRGVPWGISESAYNRVDAGLNYQYRAFGVPGLGLKRGLEEDLVIAPYASMMALMVAPEKACKNLQLMAEEGFMGEYGFFEAIDYTPSRLPRGRANSIIQSYMVHHQGMGFLSLAYLLLNKPMQNRFVAELRFQATLLLLQERIPRATLFYAHNTELIPISPTVTEGELRKIDTPHTLIPEVQLLSNGHYQVMITNSGGGYSRWKDLSVTRWREDTTRDNWGVFCYIKDVNTGDFWSNTYQPTLHPPKVYEAVFSPGHVSFHREDYGFETKTELVISPEDDAEMRRIRITNRSQEVKVLDITGYTEIVMASQASDEAHPAFSNLFVQTEILPEFNSVFCSRRPRSEEDASPWMFHLMEVRGAKVERVSYETDRMAFIGRGRTLVHPAAMDLDKLSGSQGAVLDPVLAIRYRVTIKPGRTAMVDMIYGIGETKDAAQGLMHKYRDQHLKNRAFELSWTHSQVLLRQIDISEAEAQLYDRLAASVIYMNPFLRAESTVIQNNLRGQSGLWSHSVSGDLPIVLLHIHDPENIALVGQMIRAHAYWRLKGLFVDLVIWNEDYSAYRQALQELIQGMILGEAGNNLVPGKPANIFVKSADQISGEDRILFESIARVIIRDNKGSLAQQVGTLAAEVVLPAALVPGPVGPTALSRDNPLTLPDKLQFFNGTGGFTEDGKAYKIGISRKETTPAPWVNVIANPEFGSIISESGSAYTWAVNAHEYRLTPWRNDPVSDTGGEAFYLRDEDTGHFWSPSPFPVRGETAYITTHGFGYSLFEHVESGISTEMTVFVDKMHPVKFIVLKVKNLSGKTKTLSATGFMEMVLGDVRSKTNMHIIGEQDDDTGALIMRNRYNTAFTERVTYFHVVGPNLSFTTDRTEFIGRNKGLESPQAMFKSKLSGRSGAGLDSCAALQIKFDLLDGEDRELVFQLGSCANLADAITAIQMFSKPQTVRSSLREVTTYWEQLLGTVQVNTPNAALNLMANGWLTYQTLASRLFARSGFYQSGGAFGFRDQLQDVLALLLIEPTLARDQILLNASRQFMEGDVQHWWHPPEGRGVRTKCSDDLLWLPYVVERYLTATSDREILNVKVGYLESRTLHQDEDSLYDLPVSGNQRGTLYEHCVRAIRYSFRFGVHGLPLIGSGDWNDGMDQVGHKGQGESVWLGFFLYQVLTGFAKVAESHQDSAFARDCEREAALLKVNIEKSAWDGDWYLRAWFDDGSPMGSSRNAECQIDAIAQSWSVLSGVAPAERAIHAMASLDRLLVRRDIKLIQLLDPPFDKDGPNPGYIKGYVPGIRENGGQYSHAAIWTLMAFAALRDRAKTWDLFNMIQPVGHAADPDAVQVYKVEPYVMAADVYANVAHEGRGGWTWYTGSAGWMYQFITSSLIGMVREGSSLRFKPCFPVDWPSVRVDYRYGTSRYHIQIYQVSEGVSFHWTMDGVHGEGNSIPLEDDGQEHHSEVFA